MMIHVKDSVWSDTKELKTARLIYSITGLAKMEVSALVATWEDVDISLFFFSSNVKDVSESLST